MASQYTKKEKFTVFAVLAVLFAVFLYLRFEVFV